jgi:hypothetical protein
MKKQTQKGFAHVEALLLTVLITIIGFTLWYVWHSNNNAKKALDSAASLNQSIKTTKKSNSASSKKTSTPSVINYTAKSANGVTVAGDSDIDKLSGASDSLKDFLKSDLHGHKHGPCGNAYGLFVKRIWNDKFAVGGVLGGETDCKNTNKLWAQVSAQWKEIGSTTDNFDCSILEQYKVPSAIVQNCMKNGQLVNNTQT